MTESNSLVAILNGLQNGDADAANALWQECYPRLVALARRKLEGVPRKMADEEDVAISAIKSFCKAAALGRFPDLNDRDDLWKLLISITIRKSIDLRRKESRRRASGESAFGHSDNDRAGIGDVPGTISEEAAAIAIIEELEHKLGILNSDWSKVAVAKLEGYTNAEIAEQCGIALRTVERQLALIRRKWTEHDSDSNL